MHYKEKNRNKIIKHFSLGNSFNTCPLKNKKHLVSSASAALKIHINIKEREREKEGKIETENEIKNQQRERDKEKKTIVINRIIGSFPWILKLKI